MEIDFLGVGWNSGFPDAKEEEEEEQNGTKDSTTSGVPKSLPESVRTLEMQWSFSDKVSKPSQILSFHASPEEKAGKTTRDFDPKLLDNSFQKNALDMPAQRYYMVNGFPIRQFQAQSVGFNHEMNKLPGLSHPSQTIMNVPVIQSLPPVLNSPHFPAGHTSIFPSSHPQIGVTICRDTNAPKSTGLPAQLTIFFGGSVYVYDDVSPNKAQAIMSLARSSSSASPSKPVSMARVQTQHVRPFLDETCNVKKSSSLSFSSSSAHTHHVITQQVVMTPPALIPAVAIPQARKVSLARFLERRKERIIKVSPYSLNKSSPEQSGLPSDNLCSSAANATDK